MSPRSYQLGQREAAVTDTRARIVAAARELLAADGIHGLVIHEVAERADVARATVYYQFGSKRGLLAAVIGDVQRRGRQDEIARAAEGGDPIDALHQTFVQGCRFWAAEHVIVRRLIGLAALDPDIRAAIAGADTGRLTLVTRIADRLADADHLASGYSRDKAIDVLWLLSSFEAFDQLFTRRQLAPPDVATVLLNLAREMLRQPGEDPQT